MREGNAAAVGGELGGQCDSGNGKRGRTTASPETTIARRGRPDDQLGQEMTMTIDLKETGRWPARGVGRRPTRGARLRLASERSELARRVRTNFFFFLFFSFPFLFLCDFYFSLDFFFGLQ